MKLIGRNVSAYRSYGIFNKMILLISFLLLISFVFSLTVLQYVYRIYDKQIYEKASEVLGMSSISIENELRELEQLSYTVVSDEQIQDSLRKLQANPEPYERQLIHNKIINRLVAFAGAEKYVYSMMLMDTNNGIMTAGNREGVPQELQDQLKPLALKGDGSTVWYTHGNKNSLLAVRQIKSYTGSTFTLDNLGTLVIRVRIDRVIADSTSNTSDGDQIIVVDTTSAQAIYPEKSILLPEELQKEIVNPAPYRTAKYQGGTYFIAKTESSYMDWTYINATPFNEMFKQITFVKKLVVMIIAQDLLQEILLSATIGSSLLILLEDKGDTAQNSPQLKRISEVQEVFYKFYKMNVTIAVSDTDLMIHSRKLYRQTLECLKHRFYLEDGGLIIGSDILDDQLSGGDDLELDEDQICLLIKAGDQNNVDLELERLFNQLSEQRFDINVTRSYVLQLYSAMIRLALPDERNSFTSGMAELAEIKTLGGLKYGLV